jgi:hypothetical protein
LHADLMKTKALYGFAPDLEPFADKTPSEQAELLALWGCTAVFGGFEDDAFVDAAHAAGLKVYAEFSCCVHKSWWDEFPESRPVTDTGSPLEPDGWYYGVNPSTPAVRRHLLKSFERLLVRHPVDGVWLDFIRWPCHWEARDPYLPQTSFDAQTLDRFRRDTGVEVTIENPYLAAESLLGSNSAQWTAWRCQQIVSWVEQARQSLRRSRPGAILGLFGVPWRLFDHEGAILNVVGQDYAALAPHVDVFSPMTYHAMCDQPVHWIGEVADEVRVLTGKPVWPIIQSVDEPRRLPAAEYAAALDVALHHPAPAGVIVFTLKGALEGERCGVTQDRFAQAMG